MPIRSTDTRMSVAPFQGAEDFEQRRGNADVLVLPPYQTAKYLAGFANSDRCIEAAQRLRYEVFNVELDEGLAGSAVTGLDRDEFDDQMTHVVLLDQDSGSVVGTYRIQTVRHGLERGGIYSALEYDLTDFAPYFDRAVETGRASLAKDHRTFPALVSLLLGIGAYMNAYGQKYVFGCCSLTTQDPDDGWRAMKTIREQGFLHEDLLLPARPVATCGDPSREFDPEIGAAIRLPKLFRTYMRLGAKVISGPAIDRDFGTVDFLILMDGHQVQFSPLDVVK